MSKMPLTIYLPAKLSVQVKREAERAGQSQSAFVTELLEKHFADGTDPVADMVANQLARLLAFADQSIELLPVEQRSETKTKIDERAKKYQAAVKERLKI
jgi:hypothetical protein